MGTKRENGYLPLNAYAFLADGHAGALVGVDGSIDWLAAPRLDAPPVCAALLDPLYGGAIRLGPAVPHEVSQRYLPDTMLVETTFRCADSLVRVTDSLNRSPAGPLPWTELARSVEVTGDPVPMRCEIRPGHRLGTSRSWGEWRQDTPVLHDGPLLLTVVTEGVGTPRVDGGAVTADFTAASEDSCLVAVVVNESDPAPIPTPAAVRARMEQTAEFWRTWTERVDFDGPHADEVRRSALVLKGLTLAPESGMLAALTTSLPEQIGGERNMDYRFGWIRDASFAIDAMSSVNLREEVHGSVSWLLNAVRRTAPEVRPLYTVHCEPVSPQISTRDELPGYRGSQPVRVGNSAADMRQLGGYGDLMDAVWRYADHRAALDPSLAETLAQIADHLCDLWPSKDGGLWELPDFAHYTTSKIGCWVALDRAVRLVETGQLPASRVDRWRRERDTVHAWTDEHCWSDTKESYTFHADTDELDCSVLLAARTHFLDGSDPRLASTIAAIRTELTAGGPLLYRYSGMAGQEGAFLACSFWLVEAMAAAGQRDEARAVLDELLGYAGETGLLTEEVDPGTGELLGNLPQGLSHLALIGAAGAVS